MIGIRRALLVSTADKYFSLVVNIVTLAVVSRLLSPAEIGVSVVGTAVITLALALREFGSSGFLIQQQNLTQEDARTVFTFQFLITVLIAAGLIAAAPIIATSFGQPGLRSYLYVVTAGIVIEALALPTSSLLRRELAFGTLALINVSTAAASATFSIALAASGFSFMSMAWAWLFSATMTAALTVCIRPNIWIYRPSLRSWRHVLTFGWYGGGVTILTWMSETLPQLVLGRVLPIEIVGHYNRAVLICSLPDKVVLMGVSAVATPALAAEVRAGRCIKPTYLRSLSYITAIHWPGLACLLLLAHPVIGIVLGRQWLDIVPIVQVLCLAGLFRFPSVITASTLIAVGAIGHTFRASLLSLPVSALLLCLASPWGPIAMAWAQVAAVLLQTGIALHFVRIHMKFDWWELAAALKQSAVVAACSILGPLVIIAMTAFDFELGALSSGLALLSAALGWGLGIWMSRHPILDEIGREGAVFGPIVRRLRARTIVPTRTSRLGGSSPF